MRTEWFWDHLNTYEAAPYCPPENIIPISPFCTGTVTPAPELRNCDYRWNLSPTNPSGGHCGHHRTITVGGIDYAWQSAGSKHYNFRAREGQNPPPPNVGRTDSRSRCYDGNQAQSESLVGTSPSPTERYLAVGSAAPSSGNHCGEWEDEPHSHGTTTTARPTTTTTSPGGGTWSGACSYDFDVGASASQNLPTHSGSGVTGYSYSGDAPAGMSVSGSLTLRTSGTPTGAGMGGDNLEVARGTITAEGIDETQHCTFRVHGEEEETETTTTTRPGPPSIDGWSPPYCEIDLVLGRDYGSVADYGIEMPIYDDADEDRHYHRYSGSRPRGIYFGRIREEGVPRGWLYLYGTPDEPGTFEGRMRVRYAPDLPCVITVPTPPDVWTPDTCEVELQFGVNESGTMASHSWPSRYYSFVWDDDRPPGVSVSGNRWWGTPTGVGEWSGTLTNVPSASQLERKSIACTFRVPQPDTSDWSQPTCEFTMQLGDWYGESADDAWLHLPYHLDYWEEEMEYVGDIPPGLSKAKNPTFVAEIVVWGYPTRAGTWYGRIRVPSDPTAQQMPCSWVVEDTAEWDPDTCDYVLEEEEPYGWERLPTHPWVDYLEHWVDGTEYRWRWLTSNHGSLNAEFDEWGWWQSQDGPDPPTGTATEYVVRGRREAVVPGLVTQTVDCTFTVHEKVLPPLGEIVPPEDVDPEDTIPPDKDPEDVCALPEIATHLDDTVAAEPLHNLGLLPRVAGFVGLEMESFYDVDSSLSTTYHSFWVSGGDHIIEIRVWLQRMRWWFTTMGTETPQAVTFSRSSVSGQSVTYWSTARDMRSDVVFRRSSSGAGYPDGYPIRVDAVWTGRCRPQGTSAWLSMGTETVSTNHEYPVTEIRSR